MAVDLGLALAEKVEIRTVQDENDSAPSHFHPPASEYLGAPSAVYW